MPYQIISKRDFNYRIRIDQYIGCVVDEFKTVEIPDGWIDSFLNIINIRKGNVIIEVLRSDDIALDFSRSSDSEDMRHNRFLPPPNLSKVEYASYEGHRREYQKISKFMLLSRLLKGISTNQHKLACNITIVLPDDWHFEGIDDFVAEGSQSLGRDHDRPASAKSHARHCKCPNRRADGLDCSFSSEKDDGPRCHCVNTSRDRVFFQSTPYNRDSKSFLYGTVAFASNLSLPANSSPFFDSYSNAGEAFTKLNQLIERKKKALSRYSNTASVSIETICNMSNISVKAFKELLRNNDRSKRGTVFALGVGLQLNKEEFNFLLRIKGYSINTAIFERDAIVWKYVSENYSNVPGDSLPVDYINIELAQRNLCSLGK